MRVPQVNDRVKEAPAQALRAMFAGIGSLLSVTDKIRNKPATAAAPASAAKPQTTNIPETNITPEATTTQETSSARGTAIAPESPATAETTSTAETAITPEQPSASEKPSTRERPAISGEAAALPLPNYDDLSVASLRARLRNLTAEQLETLIEYEKGHAGRAEVVAMFERRIAKIAES